RRAGIGRADHWRLNAISTRAKLSMVIPPPLTQWTTAGGATPLVPARALFDHPAPGSPPPIHLPMVTQQTSPGAGKNFVSSPSLKRLSGPLTARALVILSW